ncbi:hypothetical protein [Alteribacter salitolerans]|nr:hypothetical protein [Alteribacter salitolerans]
MAENGLFCKNHFEDKNEVTCQKHPVDFYLKSVIFTMRVIHIKM